MASSVDMELGDMMYELCLMALFFVEGANLLVPFRENFNFGQILFFLQRVHRRRGMGAESPKTVGHGKNTYTGCRFE